MQKPLVLRVAVPTPLRRRFDYLAPEGVNEHQLLPGIRVSVPFGKKTITAILLEYSYETDVAPNKLKSAITLLDEQAIIPTNILSWLIWMADYYHHPIGDVIFSAIPALLRQGKPISHAYQDRWNLKSSINNNDIDDLKRAPKQQALAKLLQQHPDGLDGEQLNTFFENWRPALKALDEKSWLEKKQALAFLAHPSTPPNPPLLNDEQQSAVEKIKQHNDQFHAFLLDGVTGSGKTEVYLRVIEETISRDKQALILVPEIGLTPQFLRRFQERFSHSIALLHSGMSDSERLLHWLAIKQNKAKILIGTRSAVFSPFENLGVIIIDEEHDGSYKQQDSFRYSARDMAVIRAHREKIPIILGSATPSFESLNNVENKRYTSLHLTQRAGLAVQPKFHLIDLKGQILKENLSHTLINTMKKHLENNNQILLFLNRRGYAPAMLCHQCGWVAMCNRCELPLTLHFNSKRLRCHHCGKDQRVPPQCPDCSTIDLNAQGYGTERVEQLLNELFPHSEVIRVDRDSTRGKNRLHALIEKVQDGKNQILLGTQMLAKGHDFPNVTLVGILDADQGLYGSDFRSLEKLAQLITQVAGRAGRGEKSGQVLIQTHHPDHPLLQTLINHGYSRFAREAMTERAAAALPPFTFSALIRAESNQLSLGMAFLSGLVQQLHKYRHEGNAGQLMLLGPVPAPMEKKAGRYRAQLLILSGERSRLHQGLNQIMPSLEKERKVRWSLDVDPIDLS